MDVGAAVSGVVSQDAESPPRPPPTETFTGEDDWTVADSEAAEVEMVSFRRGRAGGARRCSHASIYLLENIQHVRINISTHVSVV